MESFSILQGNYKLRLTVLVIGDCEIPRWEATCRICGDEDEREDSELRSESGIDATFGIVEGAETSLPSGLGGVVRSEI